jgi:hypothetical protein
VSRTRLPLRSVAGLAVLLPLLLSAGCLGAPTDDPDPTTNATVQVTNEGAEPYRASVYVVTEPVDGVRVTGPDGTNRTFDADRPSAVPAAALGNATAIEPLDEGRRSWQVTVEPNTGVSKTFDAVPSNASVVWTLARPGSDSRPLRGWGTVACGRDADEPTLRLTVRTAGPVSAEVTCRSAS